MKKYINFMKLLLLIMIFTFSLTAQNKPDHYDKILQQTKAAEKKASKLPANEKKIASIILDKINLMTKDNAKSNYNGKTMVKKYSNKRIKVDGNGRVRIKISLLKNAAKHEFDLRVDKVKRNNGKIISTYYPEPEIDWKPEIHCFLDYSLIREMAKDSIIANIMASIPARNRTGSITTAGDTQLYAALARTQKNVDGSGVKVGVISDGVWDRDISAGTYDLPNFISLVTPDCTGFEGTAMMEIIYDIAPGCSFSFGSDKANGGGSTGMITTINDLIINGCKIIVDDVYFYDDPMFSDGPLAQHIHDKIEYNDITYISATGNDGEYMWGDYYSEAYDGWLDWYYSGNSHIQNQITVYGNETIYIDLQWADNWYDAEANYDIYLYDDLGNSVGTGGKLVQGSGNYLEPREELMWTNNLGYQRFCYIQVKRVSGESREIKLLSDRHPLEYNHSSSTSLPKNQVYGHPASLGAISVAAYSVFKPDELEPYSSRGPTNIWSYPVGTVETRDTPTITATDSCLTTVAGFDTFAGTSASAPHVAGIAALYYDKFSTATPEDFYTALTDSADNIDGGTGGTWNNKSGYGKADAYGALGGGPLSITVHQINSGLSSTGSIDHWENNTWQNYSNLPYSFEWNLNSTHTVRATRGVIGNEKYREWVDNNDSTIYINYSHFTIDQFTSDLTAFLKPAKVSTIETELISGGAGPNVIEFKDPWYDDLNESPYGYKNRGTAAIFHEQTSPLNLTLASDYKGVFLNQEFDDPLYYFVNAGDGYLATTDGIYEFSHWVAEPVNSADFENANARETAVVFRAENATVKAMYQAVNSIPNYTVTVSQGEELTIPAGANIQCAEGFTIEVEGSLIAEGTKEQPITLTSSGKLSSFDPYNLDYSNLDAHTLIKSTGSNSNIEMNHVIINDAKYGLQLNNTASTIDIKNVEIYDSNIGVLINKPDDSIIILDSLYLHDNDCGLSFGNAQADENQESIIIVDRCIFANSNDFAVFFRPKAEYALSPGITSEIYLNILSCTFWNNDQGIYFQTAGTTNFGKIYTDIVSTIFEQSHCTFYPGQYELRWSTANVYYNSGGMPDYLAEIFSDPCLIDPNNGNFHISSNSPCIDAGDAGWCVMEYDDYCIPEEDIDGTLPDIGVHFHPKLQGTISENMTIGGEIQVLNYLTIADGVTLTIEENSTVFVNAGKRINVYGSLNAMGTAANKVIFTRSDPNSTSATYWQGIYGVSADNFSLNNCEIHGAINGSYVKYEPASFNNVLFETCNTGIKFYYSNYSNVTNSNFNNCGNAINYSHSTTHLNNNNIQNCNYGIYSIRGYGYVKENIISNNNYDGLFLTDMSGLQLETESESEIFPVNNIIENNQRYGVYISSNSNPNLGTYFEIPEFILGGFNQFNHEEGQYDIYSLNESIIKAEVNYWPEGDNNNGIIDINPTAADLGKNMMAKITGLGKITSLDSLENLISIGDSLVADSNYADAIGFYRSVIRAEPDNSISIKALIRIVTCYKKTNDLNSLLTELDDIYNSFQNNKIGTAALDNSVTIYSLLGDYNKALSRIETVVNVYSADPAMIEQTAAALYQQSMIYETLALFSPGLGKDALLVNKNLCLNKIIEDYPNTDIAKYLILFEGFEELFVQTDIIPDEYVLDPAYPNPFNSTVNIRFGLKEDADVELVVFDILGRKVWEYKSSNKMEAGYHNVRWHGTNTIGNAVASGLYLVKFKANNFTGSQKVILVK